MTVQVLFVRHTQNQSYSSDCWKRTDKTKQTSIVVSRELCFIDENKPTKVYRIFFLEYLKMQPGGQSIVDRLLAAKNTIAGQSLAKVVCKATTEEMIGPKRKHLDCNNQNLHKTFFVFDSWSFSFLYSFQSSCSSNERNERFHPWSGRSLDRTRSKFIVGRMFESIGYYSSFDVLRKRSKKVWD